MLLNDEIQKRMRLHFEHHQCAAVKSQLTMPRCSDQNFRKGRASGGGRGSASICAAAAGSESSQAGTTMFRGVLSKYLSSHAFITSSRQDLVSSQHDGFVLIVVLWDSAEQRSSAGPRVCILGGGFGGCLLYTSPSPRDGLLSRMPSSA